MGDNVYGDSRLKGEIMENKKYLWIFSESNEAWYTDSLFACTSDKKKAQAIWDELREKEGKNGSVFEYRVIDIVNERILKAVGRYQNVMPEEYILEN
jgi:hypothetical protein